MAAFQKKVSLDDIWPDLDSGLSQLLTDLNEGFPKKRWMKLYTYPNARKHGSIYFSLPLRPFP